MPTYILQCSACDSRSERFAKAKDRDALRCESCGRPLETHPDQFKNTGIGSSFKRKERESRTMAFQEAGIPDIMRDCPSMDLKVRDGEAVPVFHDDKHQRRCMKEMAAAGGRYKAEAAEKRRARQIKKRPKELQTWLKQRAAKQASPRST